MTVNCCSVRNKIHHLMYVAETEDIDIICVQETWLKKSDSPLIQIINEYGYRIVTERKCRKNDIGGGIAIIFKKSIKLKRVYYKQPSSFESISMQFESPNTKYTLTNIYYPGYSPKHKFTRTAFIEELDDLLITSLNDDSEHVIFGDFNIHVENESLNETVLFNEIISKHNFEQIVASSTHKHGGILDLVLVNRSILGKFNDLEVHNNLKLSDHFPVTLNMEVDVCQSRPKIKVKSHKFTEDHAVLFSRSITNKTASNPGSNVNQLVESFNEICAQSCKEVCPPLERFVFRRTSQVWYDETLRNLKQETRCAERAWRKNKNMDTESRYLTLKLNYFKLIEEKRGSYYNRRISHANGNMRDLFNIVNSLSGDRNEKILPENICIEILPEKFALYFDSKIQKLRNSLIEDIPISVDQENDVENSIIEDETGLNQFQTINILQLKAQFKDMNKKYCVGDPVPIKMISSCFDSLCPLILEIVNESLTSGIFPQPLKHAIVSPIIKDENGDREDFKNYRPISNTPILAKIIEKTILIQLNNYLSDNNLYIESQSAYKKDHSCETAVLKIINDIQDEFSKNNMVILLMLDLSAAFDTIDQDILLSKLENQFKIGGNALKLLTSYLKNRTYAVHINEKWSDVHDLTYGVPQGSILGPMLFSLYISDIESIALQDGLTPQMYADDTSLYIGFQPLTEFSTSARKIGECLSRIREFMTKNYLKLNVDKTQVIFCGLPRTLSLHQSRTREICDIIEVDEQNVKKSAKSLGAVIDSSLNFDDMIFETCRGAYFKLNKLQNMRDVLPEDLKLTLIKCYVISRIDYCNFMYANCPKKKINKLQKCLNSAVRFVYNVRKSSSITPFLKKAHILPMSYRIKYKLCFYMYKISRQSAPAYLCRMFQQYVTNRPLRSSEDSTIMETQLGSNTIAGKMCLTWNELPRSIRDIQSINTFKTSLKTHYFILAFGN